MIQIKEKTQDEQDYLSMIRDLKTLRGRVNKISGVSCLVIAIVPNGLGVVFYPLGLSLLSSKRTTIRGMFNKMYLGVVTKYKIMRWYK